MFCFLRKLLWRKVDGFSLIEISMVLLIIGIVAGGVLKGRDLIESAQLKSVASDIQHLQIAYANYVNSYGQLPGDDSNASSKFGPTQNGDGDGRISSGDAGNLFSHLYAAGLIDSEHFKIPKIGGTYTIISEDGHAKLLISDNGAPSINGKQLVALMSKTKEILGENNGTLETEPTDVVADKARKYIVKAKID